MTHDELREYAILEWSKKSEFGKDAQFTGLGEMKDSELLQIFHDSVPLHEDIGYVKYSGLTKTSVTWLGTVGEFDSNEHDYPKFWSESTGWVDMIKDQYIDFNPKEKHCVLAFGTNIFYSIWSE